MPWLPYPSRMVGPPLPPSSAGRRDRPSERRGSEVEVPSRPDSVGEGMPLSIGRRGRAGVAVLLANGANSASNVLLVVLLARSTSARDFGSIALVLTLVPLTVAFFRGAVVEPFVGLDVNAPRAGGRKQSVVFGAVVGILLATTGLLFLGADMAGIAVGLAVGAVATILVERDRWSAIGGGRPGQAAVADVGWLCSQVLGLALAPASGVAAAGFWAIGGIVAACVGWAASRKRLSRVEVNRPHRKFRPWWGLEYVMAAANLQAALLVLPITAGVEATGSLRAAASLLGFTTVLTSAGHQIGMVRMRGLTDEGALQREMVVVSVVAALLVLGFTMPLLALPADLGAALLGPTWEGARLVLPIMVLQKVVGTGVIGPMVALRVLDRSEGLLRDRLLLGIVTVSGSLLGGAWLGAVGAAWVIAGVALCGTLLWFRRVRLSDNDYIGLKGKAERWLRKH